MYFQVEADYYSNKAEKNIYKNFSTTTSHPLLLGLESTLLLELIAA